MGVGSSSGGIDFPESWFPEGHQPYKGIGADEKALMPMVMLNPFVIADVSRDDC
jgi:hypothetical protein